MNSILALYKACMEMEMQTAVVGTRIYRHLGIVLTVKSRLTDFSRQMSNKYASVTLSLLGNKADPRKVLKQYRK